MDAIYKETIVKLEKQLADAQKEVRSLKLAVRAEALKVKISSEYSNFGLWEYDIADDICYQYKKIDGIYDTCLDPIDHFRDTIISWGIIYADDIPVFHKMCDAMERGDKEISYDVRVVNDSCDIVWFRYEGRTVYDENGNPIRVVGRTLDVTEEKGGIGIDTDHRHDILTGALTGDVFAEVVNSRLQEKNHKNSALVIVGIDHFNELSKDTEADTDSLQRALSKILESQCAVERGSLCARIGDGVFALFLRFNDIPNLNAIVSRVIYKFYDLRFSGNSVTDRVSVSAGISVFKLNKTYETAFDEAMTAFKFAMAKGGNGYLQYNTSMVQKRNIAGEAEGLTSVGSIGAENIYHFINMAFIDDDNAHGAMYRAIGLTAEYIGASQAIFCRFGKNGADEMFMPWSADGKNTYDADRVLVKPIGDSTCIKPLLSGKDPIIIASQKADAEKYGFQFVNGGCCMICCPVVAKGDVVGYLIFASNSIVTWQESDISIITNLSAALNKLFSRLASRTARDDKEIFYKAVIDNLSIEGFTIDPDTYTVEYVGANAAKSYGLTKGDICYKKIRGSDAPCADCPTRSVREGQLTACCAHYRENDGRWLNVTASSYEKQDGKEYYAISTTDITSAISNIQTRDSLTGVLGFDRFAVDAMRIVAKNPEGRFVTVINIANFRRLNDTNGYEFGNSVLIAIADILSASVAEDELICRSEGSRFIVLFRSAGADSLLIRLKQLLISAQKQVYEKCGANIHLISGVYEMGSDNVGMMTALDRAITAQKTVKDKAYYIANMIVFYDEKFYDELRVRQYIEAHMLEALENDEFKVYYQPKVNTITGAIEGAEALVRWIRPDGEIISPGKFVPVFEQNGFISDMDFAVYRRVVADIKHWLREGYDDIPTISLNVSRHHMRDETFADKICALVDAIGVPRSFIELEITESMLTENMNRLLDTMKQLKDAGFRISVDDFGSGYSSLNLITLLPFDTLKIDGGFFLRNELTEKNKKVITSIVELAKGLNYRTVSEGVETDEQVEFLKELGCDMIQGYYYYKPMPVKDFEQLIKNK